MAAKLHVLAIAAVAACSCAYVAQDTSVGRKAPDFAATGSDGKAHTLASLTQDGKTLVLYFVKERCGANGSAVPLFDAVYRPMAEAKNVRFLMVFNSNGEAFKRFQSTYKTEIPALLDPGHTLIKAYGIRRSQGSVAIKDGQIVNEWKGYSRSSLDELGALMALAEDKKYASDVESAPERESFG